MSGLTQRQAAPRVLAFTGNTPTAVQTLVDAQVNTLNLTLSQPALKASNAASNAGQALTPGNVQPGSIVVSPMSQVAVGMTVQYMASVNWIEFLQPA